MALLTVVLILLAALFAPWLSPGDPYGGDLALTLQPPGELALLGTDGQGRDMITRLLYGLRTTLMIGFAAVAFGCGIGACGACTVHVNGTAMRSCITPVGAVSGKSVTTIEGLAQGEKLHPVQRAWIEEDVPQCGYCQAGQIMAAVDLLKRTPDPSTADINSITNLCRCGTYVRIRKAVRRAATLMKEEGRS